MEGHKQIYLPRLTLVNRIIVIFMAVVFVIDFILAKASGINLQSIFSLSGAHFFSGHIYTLLTYPFFTNSLMEVILNGLMLWLMGSEFEENWGRARYLKFLASVIIGGGLFYLLVSFLFFKSSIVFSFGLHGLNGIVASLCVAYAVIYPTRIFSFMMIFPIQAKYFCWILVIIALFQGLSSPAYIGSWGQLGAIGSGFLFMVLVSNRNFKALALKMSTLTQGGSRKKSKANLTIVKNEDEHPPKYWQ